MATEMTGIVLRENDITFKSYSDPNVSTQAEYFARARLCHHSAVRYMLGWASQCVTTDHFLTLQSLDPYNGGIPLLRAMNETERVRELESVGIRRLKMESVHSNVHAIQDLVLMISTDKRFHGLTAKEYDEDLRRGQVLYRPKFDWDDDSSDSDTDDERTVQYVPNSQQRLLDLRMKPWDIPHPGKSKEILELAPQPWYMLKNLYRKELKEVYYYSGSAYAIKFLQSLSLGNRQNIRRLVIEEDHYCVGDMVTHAHGLIPFCQENPKLRVEIRVDIVPAVLKQAYHWIDEKIRTTPLIYHLVEWLHEISLLSFRGMPQGQCSFEFVGLEPDLLHQLWGGIKRGAGIYEAIQQLPEPPYGGVKHPLVDFPPSWLEVQLHPHTHILIRQVISGELPVSFGPDLGEIWDLEQACYDLEHTIPPVNDWGNVVDFTYLKQQKDLLKELQRLHEKSKKRRWASNFRGSR